MDAISYDDFRKINIRMGKILDAVVPEGSEKLIRLRVDFGELGERTILAGIKEWYTGEDLKGKLLPFVVNLEYRQMGDLGESQGMLVACAPVVDDKRQAVLLEPTSEVEPGTEVI